MTCARILQKMVHSSLPIPVAASKCLQKIDRQLFPPSHSQIGSVCYPSMWRELSEHFIKTFSVISASLTFTAKLLNPYHRHPSVYLPSVVATVALTWFIGKYFSKQITYKHEEHISQRNFSNFLQNPHPSRILIEKLLEESFDKLMEEAKKDPKILLKKSAEGFSILGIAAHNERFISLHYRFSKLRFAAPWTELDLTQARTGLRFNKSMHQRTEFYIPLAFQHPAPELNYDYARALLQFPDLVQKAIDNKMDLLKKPSDGKSLLVCLLPRYDTDRVKPITTVFDLLMSAVTWPQEDLFEFMEQTVQTECMELLEHISAKGTIKPADFTLEQQNRIYAAAKSEKTKSLLENMGFGKPQNQTSPSTSFNPQKGIL